MAQILCADGEFSACCICNAVLPRKKEVCMMQSLETCSTVTTIPEGFGWVRDVEIVGEGVGLDFENYTYTNRQIGDKGEELAALYLERMGVEVLERNWRCSYGEVDIIARDGDTVILLEVKTRLVRDDDDEIEPEQAVGKRKRNKYEKLALVYLAKQTQVDSVRFDVAAVKILGKDHAQLHYTPTAYEWGS